MKPKKTSHWPRQRNPFLFFPSIEKVILLSEGKKWCFEKKTTLICWNSQHNYLVTQSKKPVICWKSQKKKEERGSHFGPKLNACWSNTWIRRVAVQWKRIVRFSFWSKNQLCLVKYVNKAHCGQVKKNTEVLILVQTWASVEQMLELRAWRSREKE